MYRATFPQFTHGEQHDAQELLKCLLTSLKDNASEERLCETMSAENGEASQMEKKTIVSNYHKGRGQKEGTSVVESSNVCPRQFPASDTVPRTPPDTPPLLLLDVPQRVSDTPPTTLDPHPIASSGSPTGSLPDTPQRVQDDRKELSSAPQNHASMELLTATPLRQVSTSSRPSSIVTKQGANRQSDPLSPPEITERSTLASSIGRGTLFGPKVVNKKPKRQTKSKENPKQELVVKIQRKNLKMQFPNKKRRKRPRKSRYAKKKSSPKKKLKATEANSKFLTITSNTRMPLMVRIPLRLLRGPTATKQHLAGLQRILRHLPLSPKTPTFDRFFRARAGPPGPDVSSTTDFITELFEGHLMYGTRCVECEQCTGKEESFLDLSVPIPTEAFLGSVNCKFIPLEECIEHFAASECLSGDNKYFCEECNHLTEAERFIKLSSLPPVLVLHINRFSHNSILHFIPKYRSQASSKLCNCIVIPEKFSLERWCMRKCPTKGNVYRLYAVVFHTGVSISSGHYTTAVLSSVCHPPKSEMATTPLSSQEQFTTSQVPSDKGEDVTRPTNVWYYFDDEKVTVLEQKHFAKMLLSSSKTPYILFYCSQSAPELH